MTASPLTLRKPPVPVGVNEGARISVAIAKRSAESENGRLIFSLNIMTPERTCDTLAPFYHTETGRGPFWLSGLFFPSPRGAEGGQGVV
ncbi:MAG TPA: hypothetical protein VEI28_02610 [Thermodesulfovibrionales bacterium]|nr:hypothetical protein [Thermodesulfovibrionales bacterium]